MDPPPFQTAASRERTACRQARVEPARYTSYAACQEAMTDALLRNTDLSYPVISAACQQQGLRTVEKDAPRTPRG